MRKPALAISTFIYSRMLPWYPPSLRAEFGDDMIDTFTENIAAAWQRASWRGLVFVWRAVTRDLVEIVLPYRTACAAPVLLAIITSTFLYGLMLAVIDPNRHCHK